MEPTGITNWLCVTVSEHLFGFAAERVREIAVLDRVTRAPGAPPWVIGATNLRGSILPLVDLASLLRLREAPREKATGVAGSVAAVWEGEIGGIPSSVGLLVDAVSDLIEVPASEIERSPDFGTDIPADWVLGLARTPESFALLLDLDRALRAPR